MIERRLVPLPTPVELPRTPSWLQVVRTPAEDDRAPTEVYLPKRRRFDKLRKRLAVAAYLWRVRMRLVWTRLDRAQINKWIVTTYKLIGFAVLTLIVGALISYLAANLYYWSSTSWIVPTILSPTDDHVLDLSARMAEQASMRDKLAADLADANRIIAVQEEFLDNARKALAEELADRRSELHRLALLNRDLESTGSEMRSSSRAFSRFSRHKLAAEYGAHIIDREGAINGALQLSQLAQGNLSLAQKRVEIDERAAELTRQSDSLAAIVSNEPATRHSYEVLRMLQDVKRAQLELAKARDNKRVLAAGVERYQRLVGAIAESPYLRAVQHQGTIAFVPYENLSRMQPGTSLYSCALGLLWCHRVGQVVAVLPGELPFKHPLHNSMVRGQAVQVALTDGRAAERKTLFAGGRPILF
jgi:hypothetical protein